LIIGGGLAFNGISYLQSAPEEVMSRIYMVSALLWLIGTAAVLYLVLRIEESKRKNQKVEDVQIKKPSIWKLSESENLIIGFAVVATLLAINSITVQYRTILSEFTLVGQIIIGLAGLWLGISFIFFYISFQSSIVTRRLVKDFSSASTESKKYRIMVEKIISPLSSGRILSFNWPLSFTIVAIILGINSIMIIYTTTFMEEHSEILGRFLVIIALIWLIGSFIFLYDVLRNTQLAEELRRLHGIYKGKIEYTDKLDRKSKMLFSKRYSLRGKPDYIVKIKGKYIPVEVKTGKVPKGPHFSHIIQLAAYCLLVDENYKIRPPYGIISYSKEQKHKVDYDTNLENILHEKMVEMRDCISKNIAHRNHNRIGKCRNCSRRESCPERLDKDQT
jgi:CRISPR-associated exonuclease Cas4